MKKQKRKLTRAEKQAKARRKAEYMTVFMNGRQKSVRRPVLVDGMDPYEFIRRNADPIWLHQEEMWELMTELYENEALLLEDENRGLSVDDENEADPVEDDSIPF